MCSLSIDKTQAVFYLPPLLLTTNFIFNLKHHFECSVSYIATCVMQSSPFFKLCFLHSLILLFSFVFVLSLHSPTTFPNSPHPSPINAYLQNLLIPPDDLLIPHFCCCFITLCCETRISKH